MFVHLHTFEIMHFVCVCVCVGEREREREGDADDGYNLYHQCLSHFILILKYFI